MSLVGGSVELGLANNRPAHVVLVDSAGLPIFGSPGGGSLGAVATITTFGAAAVSTLLLASAAGRKAARVFNTSNRALLLAYASTATLALYTVAIPQGGSFKIDDYTGDVSGIWETGSLTGGCKVTQVI